MFDELRRKKLVDRHSTTIITKKQIQQTPKLSGKKQPSEKIQFTIELYPLEMKTAENGSEKERSGMKSRMHIDLVPLKCN